MMRKKTAIKTRVETSTTKHAAPQSAPLSPLEEKVVRMRHGLAAPHDLVLEQVGQNHPQTAAALAEMEQRFLSQVGPRNNPSKRKIISALRKRGR